MKTEFRTLIIAFALILAGNSFVHAQKAEEWKLDKAHTSVTFDVNHFFSTVNGTFNEFDGIFEFHPKDLRNSEFSFSIPVNSVNTNNPKRDNHLRSDDFFDAAEFPEIKFEPTSFENTGGNNYVVRGNLKIKDIVRKVSIPFEVKGVMDHPMMKGTKILGLAFNTTIDRTDYEVGVGDWASDMVVGDKVGIAVNMELNKK